MLGGVPFQLPEYAPQDGHLPVGKARPPENSPHCMHDSFGVLGVEEPDAQEEIFQVGVHPFDLLEFCQRGKRSGSRCSPGWMPQGGHMQLVA